MELRVSLLESKRKRSRAGKQGGGLGEDGEEGGGRKERVMRESCRTGRTHWGTEKNRCPGPLFLVVFIQGVQNCSPLGWHGSRA